MVERVVEVPIPVAVRGRVRGVVVEAGAGTVLEGATIRIEGEDLNALLTNADGSFVTYPLLPGEATLSISHPDYLPGTCSAVVPDQRPADASAEPASGEATASATSADATLEAASEGATASSEGTETSASSEGTVGSPVGTISGAAPIDPASLEVLVEVRCELEARPRQGSVTLHVVSDQGPLATPVQVVVEGPANRTASTDATGNLRLDQVPPGRYVVRIEAEGFFVKQQEVEVAPRGDDTIEVTLVQRPRRPLARLAGRRIQVLRQVNFVTNSDEILPTSDPLLYEVLDLLVRHPELRVVEIEGHTDDRGGAEHNLTLSQGRAEAVRAWLIAHGIAETRLVARGYGLTRPLVPNITPSNRARNRRVQFTVRETDG